MVASGLAHSSFQNVISIHPKLKRGNNKAVFTSSWVKVMVQAQICSDALMHSTGGDD